MKYKILTLADLHWGIMDEEKMWTELFHIFDFLSKYHVDMIVIAGDYFETKLYLNSRRAIRALEWFDQLFKIAKSTNVQKIRLFRGTLSHDADQLNVFKKYDDGTDFFKVYEECTVDETLPGLKCIYCPDEIMSIKEYVTKYTDNLMSNLDIGFFHGSFDVVLKKDIDITSILNSNDEDDSMDIITSITFPIKYFQSIVRYGWFGGHWHDGKQYDNVFYVGSPTRWIFGEDEPKGFGLIQVDTDSDIYCYQKILNPIAPIYDTIEIYSSSIDSNDALNDAMDEITSSVDEKLIKAEETNIETHIRIMIYEDEKSVLSENLIRALKDKYVSVSNVVLRVKSKDKKKSKNDNKKDVSKDFSFIKDRNLSLGEQIYQFIKLKLGEEVPMDYIEKMLKKYNPQ